MNRFVAIAAALTVGLTLAACGSTPRPQVDPDVAGKPTWAGCRARVVSTVDYVPDAGGRPTARAAIAPYRSPGDHLVRRGGDSPDLADWLLLDDHAVIHASVEVEHVRSGWLVGTVEKCAR